MHLTRSRRILLFTIVLAVSSCARTRPQATQEPTPLQRPSTLSVNARLTLVIPRGIAEMGPLPEQMSGALALQARAEAVPEQPEYSHYSGTITVKVTDVQGQRVYLDYGTTVSGEVRESPSEAVWRLFGGIGRTIDLFAKSFESATTRPVAKE